jgi:hypothetical protein
MIGPYSVVVLLCGEKRGVLFAAADLALKKFLIMMRNGNTEVRLYLSDTTSKQCRVEWSC